jgi:hypothetical protein
MTGETLGALLTVLGGLLLVAGLTTMLWALYGPWGSRAPEDVLAIEPVIDLRKPVVVIDLTESDQVWSATIPASSSRRDG